MNINKSHLKVITLHPGNTIGRRIRLTERVPDDMNWPYRGVDLDQGEQAVQLAIHAVGPWRPDTDAADQWPPSTLHPIVKTGAVGAAVLPLYSPELRFGGGIVIAAVIPDLPMSLPLSVDVKSANALADLSPEPLPGGVISRESIADSINRLRHLERLAESAEALHESGYAYEELSAHSFRIDEETDRILIRPVPGLIPSGTNIEKKKDRDIRAFQGMLTSIVYPRLGPGGRRVCGLPQGTETTIRSLLRVLLRRAGRASTMPPASDSPPTDLSNWRIILDRLIQCVEASVMSDAAKTARREVVSALIDGSLDHALALAQEQESMWFQDIAMRLRDKRLSVHVNYERWCAGQQGQPLIESAERLMDLRAVGFKLPHSQEAERLDHHLSANIPHLVEAAASLREGSWRRAFNSLSVASVHDPSNPFLSNLLAIVASRSRHDKEPRQ